MHGQTEPPRGMRVTEEDLRLFTTESPAQVEAAFSQLNSDEEALKRQIQRNKQVRIYHIRIVIRLDVDLYSLDVDLYMCYKRNQMQ